MVATLERPSLATPPSTACRGDLRNSLLKLTKQVPAGHALSILEVRGDSLVKPHILSNSPHEIASRMESHPSSHFVCSARLAKGGSPEAVHWAVCFETTITHYSSEMQLAARQARILWTVEDAVKQFGFGYQPFHIRQENRLFSLFFRDGLTKAFLPVASMEIEGLSTIVERAMRLAFPPESNLDDWLRYQIEGGDPPLDPLYVQVVRVAGFPLPWQAVDYDVHIDTLISGALEGVK